MQSQVHKNVNVNMNGISKVHIFFFSHCGIKDPSWSELYHFVSFLNRQLEDFEASAFCSIAAQQDLPGFADFVLTCLLQMSRVCQHNEILFTRNSQL